MKNLADIHYEALAEAMAAINEKSEVKVQSLIQDCLLMRLRHHGFDFTVLEEHFAENPLDAHTWNRLGRLSQVPPDDQAAFLKWLDKFLASDPLQEAPRIKVPLVIDNGKNAVVATLRALVRCVRVTSASKIGGVVIPLSPTQNAEAYCNQAIFGREAHEGAMPRIREKIPKEWAGEEQFRPGDYAVYFSLDFEGDIEGRSFTLALAVAEFANFARWYVPDRELRPHPNVYCTGHVDQAGHVLPVSHIDKKLQAILQAEGVSSSEDLVNTHCLVIVPLENILLVDHDDNISKKEKCALQQRFPLAPQDSAFGLQVVPRCDEAFVKAFMMYDPTQPGCRDESTLPYLCLVDRLREEIIGWLGRKNVSSLRTSQDGRMVLLQQTILYLQENYPTRPTGRSVSKDLRLDVHETIMRLVGLELLHDIHPLGIVPNEVQESDVAGITDLVRTGIEAICLAIRLRAAKQGASPGLIRRWIVDATRKWVNGQPEEIVLLLAGWCTTVLVFSSLLNNCSVSTLLGMSPLILPLGWLCDTKNDK